MHQIQPLPEKAENHAAAEESKQRRKSSNREKPELQQSPDQNQIKSSRHKSATTTSLVLSHENPEHLSLSLSLSLFVVETERMKTKKETLQKRDADK